MVVPPAVGAVCNGGDMDGAALLAGLVVGLVLGGFIAFLWVRGSLLSRATAAEAERDLLRLRSQDLELARAESAETATLLAPLRDTIGRVERQVGALERDRVEQFGELGERLTAVSRSTESLRGARTSIFTSACSRLTFPTQGGHGSIRRYRSGPHPESR